jgi:hypothetical protein
MIKNYLKKSQNIARSGGFALLFSILTASVLLSISLAIWNIAFREVALSSFGRESQSAFYIADSAMECAFYWDFAFVKTGRNTFATSSTSVSGSAPTLSCGGKTAPISIVSVDSRNATSKFTIDFGDGRATVYVIKTDPSGTGFSATTIDAHGQNILNLSEKTLVERGLKVSY